MTEPYKVFLIIDPHYGECLAALPPHVPVWIIESDMNTPVVERLRQERAEESHLQGITTFKEKPNMSSEQQAISMLEQVDLHHGEFSTDRPYSILEIIGSTGNDDIRQELKEIGFRITVFTREGFIATRIVDA
ncbi:MAG: hypothetical protein RW306_09665 [Geobacteraceae bacterium]|nr:hypothetical protein [Geobacteraceae bacterium]